ncbi:MAG: hypothetical protein P1U68_01095 [Verrucomicrobiales bacterium]|nr:hypothetical protein [Verrucomicrobiales bacterium]
MKQILGIIAAVAIAAGSAYAGCGKKTTVTGTLSYDKDTKSLAIEGTTKPIQLQATTEVKDADGKETDIADLDGKKVDVVHEHNKADSVAPAKAS